MGMKSSSTKAGWLNLCVMGFEWMNGSGVVGRNESPEVRDGLKPTDDMFWTAINEDIASSVKDM